MRNLWFIAMGCLFLGNPCLASSRADEEIRLLDTAMQQILDGHFAGPADQNAMKTWIKVTAIAAEEPSPEVGKALRDFSDNARKRIPEAKTNNKPIIATELQIFADQAVRMAGGTPPDTSTAAPAKPEVAKPEVKAVVPIKQPEPVVTPSPPPASPLPEPVKVVDPPAVAPAPVPVKPAPVVKAIDIPAAPVPAKPAPTPVVKVVDPPAVAPAPVPIKPAPVVEAKAPEVPVAPIAFQTTAPIISREVVVPPTIASFTPSKPEPRSDPMADVYAERGDALLALKDISGARKFYEYAANGGNAHAAVALARTYDVAFAAQLGAVGMKPDPEMAARWYRKADDLKNIAAQLTGN